MRLKIECAGSTKALEKLLHSDVSSGRLQLDHVGLEGVQALAKATPVDTGLTASSWYYTVEETDGRITISWHNSNIVDHVPIAIILQYGHATKNGYWVEGSDYINPVTKDIFDKLADRVWRAVTV